MSKYEPLWETISKDTRDSFKVSFDEIEKILGFPIDHSFLKFKKELIEYGFIVKKISMKENYVLINRNEAE